MRDVSATLVEATITLVFGCYSNICYYYSGVNLEYKGYILNSKVVFGSLVSYFSS